MCSEERERPDGSAEAPDTITVGGHTVPREHYERACDFFRARIPEHAFRDKVQFLQSHYFKRMAYTPKVDPAMSYEDNIGLCAVAALMGKDRWPAFWDAVTNQKPKGEQRPEEPRRRPSTASDTKTLQRACVPRICAIRAVETRADVPSKIRSWVDGYHGEGTPWLWIISPDEVTRGQLAAHAILGADKAIDEGRAHLGQIHYVDAYDLCGHSDSAKLLGPNNRTEIRQTYSKYALLVIGNLGGESANERNLDTLATIIARRHMDQLPTVLTSAKRCSEWLDPYKRVNRQRAEDMCDRIRQGLSGYEEDGAKARTQLAAHIVSAP